MLNGVLFLRYLSLLFFVFCFFFLKKEEEEEYIQWMKGKKEQVEDVDQAQDAAELVSCPNTKRQGTLLVVTLQVNDHTNLNGKE